MRQFVRMTVRWDSLASYGQSESDCLDQYVWIKTRVWSPIETEDEIRSLLVAPRATTETVALFRHLKTITRRGTLIGQQDPHVTCAE